MLLTLTGTGWAQLHYSTLHRFGDPTKMAGVPDDNVVLGKDGAFYGTTVSGGVYGKGTVFKMSIDGSSFNVLYSFGGQFGDAINPQAALVQGTDGVLYGTTAQGGTNRPGSLYGGAGTVFKINPDGSGYAMLHQFGGSTNDGTFPEAAMIQGSDGALYGATSQGGTNRPTQLSGGFGTVFKINPDGGGYVTLHHFGGQGDGRSPYAPLIQGSDLALYGTTSAGGDASGSGIAFKLKADGSSYSILHTFGGPGDGKSPSAPLLQGSDQALYGTTVTGGTNDYGTVFKLNADGGGYGVLHDFDRVSGNGTYIYSGVIEGSDHRLYGAASIRAIGSNSGLLFSLGRDGSGFTIFHSFGGPVDAGAGPTSSLFETADGTLYGVTRTGGLGSQGTVFKTREDGGGYTVLWSFSVSAGDGATPQAGLLTAKDGTLYGTASAGGTYGQGAVFQMKQDGTGYGLVFSFGGDTNGGTTPGGVLLQASDGALYGTTVAGAAPGLGNQGTIFRLNPDGTGHTVLYSFRGSGSDGYSPQSKLIEGSDGFLYGTTSYGGTNGTFGFTGGTLFKLDKSGANYAVLHQFGATNDGINPTPVLLEGNDHALYGVTASGGTNGNSYSGGTLFKVNRDGTGYSVLYHFGATHDAANPRGLVEGADGLLYGTTGGGGTNGFSGGGTVFKIGKDGNGYALLHQFGASGDGTVPDALIRARDGSLYGTTASGGASFSGTVFHFASDGTAYNLVYSFNGQATDGTTPQGLAEGDNGALFGTMRSGGNGIGAVFGLGATVTQPNQPPIVANPIPDQTAAYGSAFSFTFPANTFSDPDAGQVLTYQAANLPPGILFDAGARNFSGLPSQPGSYSVTITATDNGTPALSTNTVFTIAVPASPVAAALQANGSLRLSFVGVPLANYEVQATDSLLPANWTAIATQPSAGDGSFAFVDPDAPKHPIRFYRTMKR